MEAKKPSNGSLFKKQWGFSKSLKRAMAKYSSRSEHGTINYLSLEDYREIRKENKKKVKVIQKKKHAEARLARAANPKKPKTNKKKKGGS